MRFKSGVVLWLMHYRIIQLLRNGSTLDLVFQSHAGRDCIVTAGRDGKHHGDSYIDGSDHYDGRALDCRTRDMNARQIQQTAADLKAELGDNWFILIEPSHIHIAYDPEHRYAR